MNDERSTARNTTSRTRTRRRRGMALGALGAVLLAAVLFLIFHQSGTGLQRPGKPPLGVLREPMGERAYRVTAWSLGDVDSLTTAVMAQAVDEIDFDWYQSRRDGSVAALHENLDLVATARENDLNIFATVTNLSGSDFDRRIAADILATPESRTNHVNTLVALVMTKGYDGIDLDWEALKGSDRDAYSLFVEELAAALHARQRFLSIAVFPKTSEPGSWDSQVAADYARLGTAVDEFKIMTYSYAGGWSAPGAQAPTAWVDEVLTFAESLVPAEKITMGIPFFGFDWHGTAAAAVKSRDAAAAAAQYGGTVARDPLSGEAILTYTDDTGVSHTVYFQDREAIAHKLRTLTERHPRLAGISIWVMGQEEPELWKAIARGLR